MNREMKNLRRALEPIAPEVAESSPIPAGVVSPMPRKSIRTKIDERKRQLRRPIR